ncbi:MULTISPECIES: UDP-N-acetylmuramoyl-tripeptide--D-alanyl-D-alanine ligase [Paenibacillus]|uniref:UDP-N-acetylmuramoyl-tripeptide--D-alanyl-D-alanine ligase n=1 Tax=Paenibacillus campinasensis TaxID=66347 RepID=A0A268F4S6_9BACL|nr:UDP-N-acetylmuramoyl-tripeptide--D-alanyl-D-alanine ligase [Paenibacillus campinasensis]MUG64653.1 UDP-N-acetylmuramoyl-tripeptide--D-alanyl-D-alanine ligase [Paenibacillus campinasensis]PAD80373.1 UDP-N-acetylmuramoyl-tripeptide--D-alanyl-D-alanine ligase [Paenibacillus campinasensis]
MIHKTLRSIADMCGGTLSPNLDENTMIHGVGTDSRTIQSGQLFVPIVGEKFDGHQFVRQVLDQGAGAALWQRDHGPAPEGPVIVVEDSLAALQALAKAYLRQSGAKVVGITGSNGKTTVKDMVSALLETRYKVHKTKGNYNNHIGLPLTVLAMEEGTEIIVLEMGMSGRHEIELLSGLANPDIAVITNIGEAHLLQLGSREEIARAKLEIISGMKPGGLLIYHGDEPLISRVLEEASTIKPEGLQTFTFGTGSDNDSYPTGLMFHGKGIVFTSSRSAGEAFSLPLLGQHNVVNALAAMAVASELGVSEEEIREGFEGLKLTGMRIECIETRHGVTVLNDAYNSSPTAVKAAVDVLGNMKGYRRRIAVLGDMLELGPKEAEFHAEIGHYLSPDKVDIVFTYGPLSRHTAEAARQYYPENSVFAYTDKEALIASLIEQITSKDVVLVKASRGMRLEQVVEALAELPGGNNGSRG